MTSHSENKQYAENEMSFHDILPKSWRYALAHAKQSYLSDSIQSFAKSIIDRGIDLDDPRALEELEAYVEPDYPKEYQNGK